MTRTHFRLVYHIVFSTKDREPWLVPEVQESLFAYMAGIIKKLEGKALIIRGTADHVHILCTLPPKVSISSAVQTVKSNSSRWFREKYQREAFAWQESFGAFSVGIPDVDRVFAYVANQEEHHRKVTFKEEFLEFLKRAGIEYDEKYLW